MIAGLIAMNGLAIDEMGNFEVALKAVASGLVCETEAQAEAMIVTLLNAEDLAVRAMAATIVDSMMATDMIDLPREMDTMDSIIAADIDTETAAENDSRILAQEATNTIGRVIVGLVSEAIISKVDTVRGVRIEMVVITHDSPSFIVTTTDSKAVHLGIIDHISVGITSADENRSARMDDNLPHTMAGDITHGVNSVTIDDSSREWISMATVRLRKKNCSSCLVPSIRMATVLSPSGNSFMSSLPGQTRELTVSIVRRAKWKDDIVAMQAHRMTLRLTTAGTDEDRVDSDLVAQAHTIDLPRPN